MKTSKQKSLRRLALLALGLAALASGCGLSVTLPEEFKSRKQTMDPVPGSGEQAKPAESPSGLGR